MILHIKVNNLPDPKGRGITVNTNCEHLPFPKVYRMILYTKVNNFPQPAGKLITVITKCENFPSRRYTL